MSAIDFNAIFYSKGFCGVFSPHQARQPCSLALSACLGRLPPDMRMELKMMGIAH